MSEREKVEVCRLADLEPGRVHSARIGGMRVGVVLYRDEVRVFRAGCPHHGGPLDKGWIRPGVTSDVPGQILVDLESPVLTCPWHAYEFRLSDGCSLFGKKLRMRMLPCEVSDGRIWASRS